ncbi:hypothetical protein ACT028_18050, partial [Pseudomonas aeruginosa]
LPVRMSVEQVSGSAWAECPNGVESASRLVESGQLTDQQVAAISGHKSMQTLKRYTHLRAKDLVKALDNIDQSRQGARPSA